MKKPTVKLIGEDGNAFYILGACKNAAKKAGRTAEEIEIIMTEMKSGDYNYLLQVAQKYFEII